MKDIWHWAAAIAVLVTLLAAMPSVRVTTQPANEPERALAAIARASFDEDHHVEVQSGENGEGFDQPVYSDVSHVGNIWLLRQRAANSPSWRRFGMLVQNRRVYFAQLDPRTALVGAECAECHPNGPRAIRGELRAGMETDRDAINRIVTNVHVERLFYPPIEPEPKLTHAFTVAPCANCHDGNHRARLTDFNHRAIRFQTIHAQAPPHSLFTDAERQEVLDWLNRH